jgi:broad specificity phosphatase PhoE
MGTLVLVRHGQASFLAADYDKLSPVGEEQARRLGEHWARRGVTFDRVYTGPRVRHQRTAELCSEAYARAGGRAWPAIELLNDLDEMQVSDVMERHLPALAQTDPVIGALLNEFQAAAGGAGGPRAFNRLFEEVTRRWVRGEIESPDVEPWSAFITRVGRALEVMRAGRGRVAAFSSAGPVTAAIQYALKVDHGTTLELALVTRNSALTEFLFSGERLTLTAFNALPHLEDPAHFTLR